MTENYYEQVDAIFLIAKHGEDAQQESVCCARAAERAGDHASAQRWHRVRRLLARAR